MTVLGDIDKPVLRVVGDRVRVLLDGSMSEGRFELFELEGDQGSGPPPHAHPWLESYFILEGEVSIECGDEKSLAGPGATVVIPAGTVHRFEIASPMARFVIASSGDRASVFFTDLSENAPEAPSPETLPGIIEVAKRNGLTSPLF
ncbi:MAG: h16 [Acidimicrobiia bacterium]|nr:h16 [Acidimicrobiia bacterium]